LPSPPARVLGALCLLLCLWPAAATAAPAILLLSHAADEAGDARDYAEFLARSLGEKAPVHGAALRRRVESRLSLSAGPRTLTADIRGRVDRGRRLFIEGEFTRAIAELEGVRDTLLGATGLLTADASLRDALYQTLLVQAHAHHRAGDRDRATDLIAEAVRSFPEREISVAQHGPELAKLYGGVRREMARHARGTLHVSTRPAGCLVFVNERYVGLSPARVPDLYPGRYRVYVQQAHARGRVHLAEVNGVDHLIQIDFALDSVLQTEPYLGLRFPEQRTLRENEVPYGAAVGRALDAATVLLVGFRRQQGRRILHGAAVSSATGRVIRSAMVVLEPSPPSPATLQALGRFLVEGGEGHGLLIEAGESPTGAADGESAARGRGFFSARVFKWLSLGAAIAGLAAGIPLLVLDGRGTCETSVESQRCPEAYQTAAAGIALTAAGGLAAGAAGLFFYLDTRPGSPARSPAIATFPSALVGGAGIQAVMTY
jgi:hypothetical protein